MSVTKIDGNTTKILNCFFFQNKFTLWHIRINIYIWKTTFSSHKHYPVGLFFSRNAKKPHADQSILLTFILCQKRNISQTLKVGSGKKVFLKCVYHWYNLLRWMFFIMCDNWKTFFSIQTYRYREAWCNRHVAALFQATFWKSPYCIFIISTITLQCCQCHNAPTCYIFLTKLISWYLFFILSACQCSIWMFHIFLYK